MVESYKILLQMESNDSYFFENMVTMYETWIYHFCAKRKKCSPMRWKILSSLSSKKAKVTSYQVKKKISNGLLLLHDNAHGQRAQQTVQTAELCGFKILPHTAYSSDKAPPPPLLLLPFCSLILSNHPQDAVSMTTGTPLKQLGPILSLFTKKNFRRSKRRGRNVSLCPRTT